jgi:hypothetical protein
MEAQVKRSLVVATVVLAAVLSGAVLGQSTAVPRSWDEAVLRDWATPLAGLNARPGHFSEADYYRAPVDNLRTYPVYYPGREPAGYWEMVQSAGPKPLIEAARLSTDADWAHAGKRVFDEWDACVSSTRRRWPRRAAPRPSHGLACAHGQTGHCPISAGCPPPTGSRWGSRTAPAATHG